MADVILRSTNVEAGAHRADVPNFELIELLFFAYRDFVSEADEVLERFGFGRAHHRVLHFVSRNPDLKVAELLTILKITKQSLGRVLRELVDQGFIEASEGSSDRRQRLLRATPKGEELALELSIAQSQRIKRALEVSGPGTHEAAAKFLAAMINPEDSGDVAKLVRSPSMTGRRR